MDVLLLLPESGGLLGCDPGRDAKVQTMIVWCSATVRLAQSLKACWVARMNLVFAHISGDYAAGGSD
jgi:hypothetical protein